MIVNVVRVPFPGDEVGGVATLDVKAGKGTIFINSNLTEEEQLKSLRHEQLHFLLGHFESSNLDVNQCENEVHAIMDEAY